MFRLLPKMQKRVCARICIPLKHQTVTVCLPRFTPAIIYIRPGWALEKLCLRESKLIQHQPDKINQTMTSRISMSLKTFQHTLFIFSGFALSLISCNQEVKNTDPLDNYTDWAIYRGDKKGIQYSELDQINKGNVKELSVAWEYHHGKPEGPSMYSSLPAPLASSSIRRANAPRKPLILNREFLSTSSSASRLEASARSSTEPFTVRSAGRP